jgi:hypothetical protein
MVMIRLDRPPVLVRARNPWLSGKLAIAAKKLGIRVKKREYERNPPPWSRYLDYWDGASDRQKAFWSVLGSVSAETRGMSIEERIPKIRKALKDLKEELDRLGIPRKEYVPRTVYKTVLEKIPEAHRREIERYINEKLRELGLGG